MTTRQGGEKRSVAVSFSPPPPPSPLLLPLRPLQAMLQVGKRREREEGGRGGVTVIAFKHLGNLEISLRQLYPHVLAAALYTTGEMGQQQSDLNNDDCGSVNFRVPPYLEGSIMEKLLFPPPSLFRDVSTYTYSSLLLEFNSLSQRFKVEI